MLDRIEAETEGMGEAGLGHSELIANGLYIDFVGHVCFEPFPLSGEKGLHFAQAIHHLFKLALHKLTPIILKDRVGTFLQCISFCHREIFLLILWENRDQEDGKLLAAPHVNNARASAFSHSFAGNPDFAKSTSSPNHISAFRVRRNQSDDIGPLFLAKQLIGHPEISRCLDDSLHIFLCTPLDTFCQWNEFGWDSQKRVFC